MNPTHRERGSADGEEIRADRTMVPTLTLADAAFGDETAILVHLDRLEPAFEEAEATIHAFLPEPRRFERLRREAPELVARFPDPARRPPLFGIPVGVKDIFHIEGFTTRAGSRLPPEELRGPEAASVTALKRAGALILGKTVSTEFAYFPPGPTRNPHHPEHTPGGSSSGSAAAVAAGLCPLALGTQTIGSIARPASFCGVFGFKPSYDRISKAGVIPVASSLDHVGLFTADVAGGAVVAALLCHAWQAATPSRRPVLGIPEGPYPARASEEGLAHFRAVCERLAAAGFAVRPVQAMPDFAEIVERHQVVLAAEAAAVHARWFRRYGELYHPETAKLIRRGQEISEADLAAARDGREKLRDELTRLMEENGLDLWISPAACGPAPRGLESTGDPTMNLPWTHAGLPAVSLPSGLNADGLPLGLQVTGRWYDDEMLLAWAAEIEQALPPSGHGRRRHSP
ncbi:MAG: amidase [bacterium]|nr:amidase [bacterium]